MTGNARMTDRLRVVRRWSDHRERLRERALLETVSRGVVDFGSALVDA